jgi:hypothetical protein
MDLIAGRLWWVLAILLAPLAFSAVWIMGAVVFWLAASNR